MNVANPDLHAAPTAVAEPFLTQIHALIDWAMFDDDLASASAHADRPLTIEIVKLVLLRRWYNIEARAARVVLDRLSFRSFVGYAGDGRGSDAQVQAEIDDPRWIAQPELTRIVDAVDDTLRVQGYSVRAGRSEEPTLMPCTESGAAGSEIEETHLFRPGEVGRLVEAVAQKAHAEGRNVTSDNLVPQPEPHDSPLAPVIDLPVAMRMADTEVKTGGTARPQGERARAVLEWPWGQRSTLMEHLNIGRDHEFSPFARELTPYTHVSRRHAELLVYGDGVWLRDLGSRNGTYVNDEEVPKGQAYLIDSDAIVRFGPLLAVSLKILD